MTTDNVEAIFPLSPAQEGILFHSLYAPEAPLYFQQYSCTLEGPIDPGLFRAAWDVVIERHPALRSQIVWEGTKEPLQVVRRRVEPEWLVEDVSGLDEHALERHVADFIVRDQRRGFDLAAAPLVRFALFVSDHRHRFVWSHHHIVLDGWSLGIVLGEALRAYDRLVADEPLRLPPPPAYRDYVRWLKARDRSEDEAHWRGVLAGFTQPTKLGIEARTPSDSPWAERHEELVLRMDEDVTTRLEAFARARGLTLGTVLAGAWAQVLARYGPSDDVVFGTTVSGRPPEVDGALDMAGMFINTLPLRAKADPDADVVDWLQGIQRQQLASSRLGATPLTDVQQWSDVPAGEPLFSTLLVLENVPEVTGDRGQLALRDARYLQRSNYPLAVLVMPGEALEIVVLHDADRFEPVAVRRLADHFFLVLSMLADGSVARLGDLRSLPADEADVIAGWNATEEGVPEDVTMVDLIAASIAARPDTPAVVCEGEVLTYAAMGSAAELVAARLRRLGVERGDRVVVAVRRSPEAVVAAVGALFAGAVYVPVDPASPDLRYRSMVEGTGAVAVVADDAERFLPGLVGILLGARGGIVGGTPVEGDGDVGEASQVSPADLAYVMHTSGSTGVPKGVAVAHGSLVNSTLARRTVYDEPVDRFLVVSPLFFDISLAGLSWSLADGGTLVLPGHDLEKDVGHLADLMAEHEVTHVLALPSVWDLLVEYADADRLRALRLAMVAGEACPPSVIARHRKSLPWAAIANEYGPTEATVWCTAHVMRTEADVVDLDGRVPIGRAIPNLRAHVLDRHGRQAPIGVPGELHVGGRGVAEGYLGDDDLTGKRFFEADPAGVGPERVYRAGDRVRWSERGLLEYLGRVDDQVKIRGWRVEPGEIEAALEAHPAVAAAAVAVREPRPGDARLVAYFVPSATASVNLTDLRRHLRERLPEHLVTRHLVKLDTMPTTTTGKIDRGALPERLGETEASPSFVEPRTPAEVLVADTVAALLDVHRPGMSDNFFDIGGHSLLAMRLVAALAADTGVRVSPRLVLLDTLGGVAAALGAEWATGVENAISRETTEARPAGGANAIHFGPPERPLFGIHQAPEKTGPAGAVLICPPIGWEYMRTHWALRRLTRALTAAGHHVLRFDYSGTGDSAGTVDDGSVDRWIEDVDMAAAELAEVADTDAVSIVGVRLGATLAVLAAAQGTSVERLVLWDPVVRGEEHLRVLEAMQQEALAGRGVPVAPELMGDELLGFPYPAGLRDRLMRIDLGTVAWPTCPTTLIASDERADERRLVESVGMAYQVRPDVSNWDGLESVYAQILPTAIPDAVVEALAPRST